MKLIAAVQQAGELARKDRESCRWPKGIFPG